MIEIYTKDDCAYCTMAKDLVDGQHSRLGVEIFHMPTDISREDLMVKFPNSRTMPIIVVDKVVIGGYNEFKLMMKDIEMREELIDDLNKGFVKVTFTKKDGTERVMNCTLKSEYLPEDYKSDVAPDAKKKVNRNILAVWDIDVSGWRSFRVDSVKDFLWSRYPETLEPSEVEGHPV